MFFVMRGFLDRRRSPVLDEIILRFMMAIRQLRSKRVKLISLQPRLQGFSLKWVGREKALASAGHVHSLNIPEKLIYMQPAGFALTEVERSNNGK